RGAASGGISDQSREVSNQKDRRVSQILKVLHLPNQHRVTDVDVRRRWIEARFDPQRFSGLLRAFQLRNQFLFADDFDRTLADVLHLFGERRCREIAHEHTTRRPSSWHFPERTKPIASEKIRCSSVRMREERVSSVS